jgi:hypothetical protein
MKKGIESVRGLRHKLCMMGIPIDGPAFVYGDNMSVIHNTQRPRVHVEEEMMRSWGLVQAKGHQSRVGTLSQRVLALSLAMVYQVPFPEDTS